MMFLAGCVAPQPSRGPSANVKVLTERVGDQTRFLVRNSEAADMTATLNVGAVNMTASLPLPCTLTIPAGQTVEAVTLTPARGTNDGWSFNYVNHYTMGRRDAVHDDSYRYALPYAAGASFAVSQGYHGQFSHTGRDEFALDWKMPEGTPVHAAREGVVVAVKDDSKSGGPKRKFEADANLITIQHADGTMAHYCHLAPHSAQVRVGQAVGAGDRLAASGNTGFTSGPHLHFAVFKARDGFGRETIPVKFRTAEESSVTLVAGRSYHAPETAVLARN